MYSPVPGFTRILSPVATNSGTFTVTPFSSLAGFVDAVFVAVFITGFVSTISSVSELGSRTVRLPNSLTLEIVETNPVMKTATKTASTKPARLENGVTVNVPEFVATGDKIRVNPGTGEYIERAK